MKSYFRPFLGNECGSIAVEAALILPVMILLAFGTIQASTYLYNKNLLTNASIEAARVGALYTSPRATVQEIANAACSFLGTTATTSISGAGVINCNAGGNLINYTGSSPAINMVVVSDTINTSGVEATGTTQTTVSGTAWATGQTPVSGVPCPSNSYNGSATGYIVVVTLTSTFNGLSGGVNSWGLFNKSVSATSKMVCQ